MDGKQVGLFLGATIYLWIYIDCHYFVPRKISKLESLQDPRYTAELQRLQKRISIFRSRKLFFNFLLVVALANLVWLVTMLLKR